MNSHCQKSDNIHPLEKFIAIAYIYLLPVRMLATFAVLRNILPGATVYIDFLLHIAGLSLFFCHHFRRSTFNTVEYRSVFSFIKLIIYLNCSSVFMAAIIQLVLGSHGQENAFSGIAGMLIYFSQYALMVLYNKWVLELVSREQLEKIWGRVCWALLILGYWQGACITAGGIFSAAYDAFNVLGVLHASDMPKLCLTGAEGASAGSLISILVMPYLFSRIISEHRCGRYLVQVFLWLIPLFFTQSSTAYILFAVCSAVFLLLLLRRNNFSKLFFLSAIILTAGIIMATFPKLLPETTQEQIDYLLLEKIDDRENGSTVSRTIPLLVNWGAFTEWPLLGVGNGLQGYFYEKYFPAWAYYATGSDALVFLERSRTGIGNGGVFIPSLLSGYGIIGCLLILVFARKYLQMAIRKKAELGEWYLQFLMAAVCILLSGFQGDFYGNYYIWFVLCLPLMPSPEPQGETDA